jgi:hypothetical protein
MNPLVWLVLWIAAAITLLGLGAVGASPVAYRRGWARATIEAAAAGERHTHRKGDPSPLPRPGRLPLIVPPGPTLDPFNPAAFMFSGAAEEWRPLGRAEYDLITTELPAADDFPCCSSLDIETDSGFTRRMAREVEAMIAAWEGDTNYWLHTHRGSN